METPAQPSFFTKRYPDLPEPVLFHPLKHHVGYIRTFILESTSISESKLKTTLLTIGSSQLDLYFGSLSPEQIASETILYLQNQQLLQPEVYRQHLTAHGSDYRIITLSDKTDWILRWGVVAGRHVHLHPARYAANTLRVKANVLKTAVATLIALQHTQEEMDVGLVNKVRAEWLLLPPLKMLEPGLLKLIKRLKEV